MIFNLMNNEQIAPLRDRLFPVSAHRETPDDKKKVQPPNGWQKGQVYEDNTFTKNAIGLRTGDGITVVDVDTKDFEKIDKEWREALAKIETFTVETFNGFHYYFKSTTEYTNRTKIAEYIDIRSEGGFVFIATENEPYITYDIHQDIPIIDLPEDIAKLLQEKKEVITIEDDDTQLLRLAKEQEENTYAPKEIYNMLMATGDEYESRDWLLSMVGSAYALLSKEDRLEKTDKTTGKKYYSLPRIINKWTKSKWADKRDVSVIEKVVSEVLNGKYGKDLNGGTLITEAREGGYELPVTEEEGDVIGNTEIVTNGTKSWVVDHLKGRMSPPMGQASLKGWLKEMGINKKTMEKMGNMPTNISGINITADYLIKEKATFGVEEHPTDVTAFPVLVVRKNPLFNVKKIDFDNEIIEDFTKNVWGGYVEDLIRTVGFTIRFGADKNLIGLIAKSRKGKTMIAEKGLGGAPVKMGGLMKAMNSEKGLGAGVIDNIKNTGIMVINEVDKPLTTEFKHFDTGKVQVDQFGANGGTMMLDIHATILTSVHGKMFSQIGSEMVERCLMFNVKDSDCKYIRLSDSPIYQKDRKRYEEHTRAYIRWLFKESIIGEHTLEELTALQTKYAVTTADAEEIQTIILEQVEETIQREAEGKDAPKADFSKKDDEYFALRKTDIKTVIERVIKEYSDEALYNAEEVENLICDKILGEGKRTHKIYGEKRYMLNIGSTEGVDIDALFAPVD